MVGLKKRVTTGFMGIVALLFLSGMLSFFELNTLSSYTDDILKTNKQNMELAGDLLTIAQRQSDAFVDIVAFEDRSKDSICLSTYKELSSALDRVREHSLDEAVVDSMVMLALKLQQISRSVIYTPILSDSLRMESRATALVKYDEYQHLYKELIASIGNYMTSAQSSLAPRAEQLNRNAYRAVTPVFISLVVMIAIVLMLYYFMMLSCVNPILHLNRALKDTLMYRVPFATKRDYRDEVQELKERIESLTTKSKQNTTL